MKFVVQNLSKHLPRLGVLKDIENKPNFQIETPAVMLHTQGGHIPHITHEVFKLVSTDPQILQIPLVSMHVFKETMNYYEGSISEFIGNKDCISCITLQDPSSLTQQGHHAKEKVPIWTKNGKIFYDSQSYMDTVEAFKPDMYYLLSDGDTNQTSAPKRVIKAVENTISFFKDCMERHKKSSVLKNTFLIAPIAGGYTIKARDKCIEAILKDDDLVCGYLIDGLHNNGPEVEFLPFEELRPVIHHVIDRLPQNKLRSVQGCWNPVTVVKMVQLGVDMFDTSYCRIMTERSAAMTFAVDCTDQVEDYEINLRQTKYSDDFQPILMGCNCLTCSKYSRGYIHHLLTVQELLGPVLIMIHNVHHYLRFFNVIKKCIGNGTLNNLENRITQQFTKHQQQLLSVQGIDRNNLEVRLQEEERGDAEN